MTSAGSTDIEAIDQQFDEVLKFLAQTIDENTSTTPPNVPTSSQSTSSASPSSASLSATPNSDTHSDNGMPAHAATSNKSSPVNNDRSSNGAGSSNSSGIGEDLHTDLYNPSNTTAITQLGLQYRSDMGSGGLMMTNNKSTQMVNNKTSNKRNSSDSAFMETVSMPSSLSLGVINRANGSGGASNGQNPAIPKSETDFKQVEI